MSNAEMNKVFQELTIAENEYPANVFENLSAIKLKYKVTMSIKDKMAKVLSVCPTMYKVVIMNK